MKTYLDFEEPIKEMEDKIEQAKELGEDTGVEMTDKISELSRKLEDKTKEILEACSTFKTSRQTLHFSLYSSSYERYFSRATWG